MRGKKNFSRCPNDEYDCLVEVRRADLSPLDPAILEKDLLVTRVLRLLSDFDWNMFSIIFCGGTSLSKGYGIIDRMSEDIDFKVQIPPQWTRSKSRRELRGLRERLAQSLEAGGFEKIQPKSHNEGRCFQFSLDYTSRFQQFTPLRPELKLEFNVQDAFLPLENVNVQSLLSEMLKQNEAPVPLQALPCQQTLVEKVVAFLRRTAEERNSEDTYNLNDEQLVRHLYDVQQLLQKLPNGNPGIKEERQFLFRKVVASDQQRFGGPDRALADHLVWKLDSTLRKLKTDALPFQEQYKLFVGELVWGQTVDFEEARAAFSQLAEELIRSYCVENGLERKQ